MPQPCGKRYPKFEACHDSSILSYISWMFLSESCTSWASWCSTACVVKSLRTCGIVPTSCWCGITATSPICHPTAPSRTVPPTQLLRPMGVLCGWSVGLEFPVGQLAESGYWREQFQTISEDVSVRNVLMHSAH